MGGLVPGRRTAAVTLLVAISLLAGCSGPLGDAERSPYEVPPSTSVGDTPTTGPGIGPDGAERWNVTVGNGSKTGPGESRYVNLQPTCERPPSLVVAIQIGALRNNERDNRGFWTAYEFLTPGYRWALGPFPRFVQQVETKYRPTVDAESVTYGSVTRSNGTASVPVTVSADDGNTTDYKWVLELIRTGEYEGCWMVSAIRNTNESG